MPVTDISHVTQSLRTLLARAVTPAPAVGIAPPEQVAESATTLNIYCYHLNVDAHNRFRPQQAGGRAIATSPTTLEMHFILTAHVASTSDFATLAEQALLGRAVKALHDVPVIDDRTRLGGEPVLPDAAQGLGNRFEITQVPMTASEALAYWANQDRIAARPAAYYAVRPVEIAPEPPSTAAGIVLSLGAFVTLSDAPSIGASESVIDYAPPTALGVGAGELTARPAKVGPRGVLRLLGNGLRDGVLALSNQHWRLLFPEAPRLSVDLDANPDWAILAIEGGIAVTVGDQLVVEGERLDLYPGLYGATWLRAGAADRAERSNEAAFTINPRITRMTREAATGAVTLDIGGTWRLTRGRAAPIDPIREPELDLRLFVDGIAYARVAAPPAEGEFAIGDHMLTYQPRPEADTPGAHAVSLVVDGAEAQPFWVEIA